MTINEFEKIDICIYNEITNKKEIKQTIMNKEKIKTIITY
ncbi:hypothetical protein CBDKU1_28580 [Clostridium butyricum DKU-01]|nr:hypothetical protein CBDKU1_28580 [Clostridium butyricum DKU-01]